MVAVTPRRNSRRLPIYFNFFPAFFATLEADFSGLVVADFVAPFLTALGARVGLSVLLSFDLSSESSFGFDSFAGFL
jgi:hypothetical protein